MKKITVVGVGALGSHVAMMLRNLADLKIIDFDRVEQKNVLSQFHGKPSVGKHKVIGLAQQIQFMFGYKIDVAPAQLRDDNVVNLLKGADLVIDCTDNGETRRLIQKHALATRLPCLHGGLAANGEFGVAVWTERFIIDDAAQGAATCEGGEHLPFICHVASYVAIAAQQFLSGGKKKSYYISPGAVIST